MKYQSIPPGLGTTYDWSNDRILVKAASDLTDGRVTVIEDTLKPGFYLPRHHHKKMLEIFYILEGEIVFGFDHESIVTTPGMVLNIPPFTWHDARCVHGGRLLTIFSPGGFDHYLQKLASLSEAQLEDQPFMTQLAENHDIWTR